MKLFIDDFRPAPPGWTHLKTLAEALALVLRAITDRQPIEAVSLDYNMPGETLKGLEGEPLRFSNFMPVALLLAANYGKISGSPKIYLHSISEGTDDMAQLLTQAGYAPKRVDNVKMYAFYTGHQPESYALLGGE